MGKTLAEMTTAEAIAYTVGKVPAVEHPSWKYRDGAYQDSFFRAAWVWLMKGGTHGIRWNGRKWGAGEIEFGEVVMRDPDGYDDEIHALCAACLLAAGEEIP